MKIWIQMSECYCLPVPWGIFSLPEAIFLPYSFEFTVLKIYSPSADWRRYIGFVKIDQWKVKIRCKNTSSAGDCQVATEIQLMSFLLLKNWLVEGCCFVWQQLNIFSQNIFQLVGTAMYLVCVFSSALDFCWPGILHSGNYCLRLVQNIQCYICTQDDTDESF